MRTAIGLSSKPTTEMSPGTANPLSSIAWMAPRAKASENASIAVGHSRADRSSSAPA
jgi:hypothetical protein